jgi:uncharacterized SAM-binding protein YcdF (DUF218 family)
MIRLLKIILAILAAYIVFILVVDNFVVENSKPQKADFVVVVSGGDTVGRTKKGIELYKQAYAPKLLLSGMPPTLRARQTQRSCASMPLKMVSQTMISSSKKTVRIPSRMQQKAFLN